MVTFISRGNRIRFQRFGYETKDPCLVGIAIFSMFPQLPAAGRLTSRLRHQGKITMHHFVQFILLELTLDLFDDAARDRVQHDDAIFFGTGQVTIAKDLFLGVPNLLFNVPAVTDCLQFDNDIILDLVDLADQ